MKMVSEIWWLVRKEAVLEWRQRYAIGGIALYAVSTVFVVYMSFIRIQPNVWNAMFWIISLFGSMNALVKSFVQENSTRQLYYYTLANPLAVILSKIIYNIGLLFLINCLTFIMLSLFAGDPVKDDWQFLGVLALGSFSLGTAFTFISAIASKGSNSSTLMAILGFPVIIPILMTLIKISANALRLIQDTAVWQDVVILAAIDTIMITLCIVLFPYLWRE